MEWLQRVKNVFSHSILASPKSAMSFQLSPLNTAAIAINQTSSGDLPVSLQTGIAQLRKILQGIFHIHFCLEKIATHRAAEEHLYASAPSPEAVKGTASAFYCNEKRPTLRVFKILVELWKFTLGTRINVRLRLVQLIFLIYLVLVGLFTAKLGILMANDPDARTWTLGEWLIDYQGGPVRRGLIGEGIQELARWIHVSPVSTVIAMQLILYGILFLSVWMLLQGSEWPYWATALAFSPATLGFQILNPQGGFRKEIFVLAGLGFLVCMLADGYVGEVFLSVYLALLVAVTTLSHEIVLCWLPYFAAAISMELGDIRRILRVLATPATVAVVAATFVVLHPGNSRIANDICSSLLKSDGAELKDVCGGAIRHLADSPRAARQGVRLLTQLYPVYRIYGSCLVLA